MRSQSTSSCGNWRACLCGSVAVLAVLLYAGNGIAAEGQGGSDGSQKIFVASYYFPNYHPGDPRNDKEKGKGWCEWELVKAARPRFPGHDQPKIPMWGYVDESDPQVMQQKIAAAADHGIDAFIYDWYFYDDGPFLEAGLERGFMKAPNANRLKFGLMWANHDWVDIFPATAHVEPRLVYPGQVSQAGWERMNDYVIKTYFQHPSYWKIDGKPYFSIYDLNSLLRSFGSVAATRAALDQFRAKAVQAGLPGLHLNAVVWGRPVLPTERVPVDAAKLVTDLGFDSTTSYVWIHHVPLKWPTVDYQEIRDGYLPHWDRMLRDFQQPYFPNASMGWDPTPRTRQDQPWVEARYPFTGVITGNTPAAFEEALQLVKKTIVSGAYRTQSTDDQLLERMDRGELFGA